MEPIVLDNGNLRLSFDPGNGALCALSAPALGWDLLDRPALGLSFRLLVPLGEEKRNNAVLGERQRLASFRLSADGRRLDLAWDGVTSENTGPLDLRVELSVTLEGEAAVFRMRLSNHTPYVVESAHCPYLGDVRPPPGAPWMRSFGASYASAAEWELWPRFENHMGYYGFDYPQQPYGTMPSMPFVLLRGPDAGLYAGVRDDASELVAWHGELRPGWDESMASRVPATPEIAGKPVHVRFAAIHMPYIRPGETRDLAPIALQSFRGGWHRGADLYRAWRETLWKPCAPPAWAADPHAWLQLHVNSPEDELRLRFADLPAVAEECARAGVKAIQLVGWNDGGQDQGNPSHDPDPRLGTFGELKAAIAACHALGVRIVLFAKFTWSDRATDRYRRELRASAVQDPYGDDYVYRGYQYQTPAQMLDINTKRLIPMCFHDPAYRAVCDAEFQKLVDLGAAGMLYDECQHHGGALACFAPDHGHRPGAPVYQKDRALVEGFRALPGVPADFLVAGEACYDFEMQSYALAYFRTEDRNHVPLPRYLHPRSLYMTALTGFDDRDMVGQCLMYRYVLSYEPYNFKGRLPDFPATVAYGTAMDRLRTDLRKWFWDGVFQDTCGARVLRTDGTPHAPYAVFRAADGSLGVVACNYGDDPVEVVVTPESGTLSRYRLIDDDAWRDARTVRIPGRSAAAVV